MEQDVTWVVQRATIALLGHSVESGQQSPARLLSSKALSALSSDRRKLAFAWQQQLAIADLSAASNSPGAIFRGASPPSLGSEETITALCWVSFVPQGASNLVEPYLLVGTSLGYLHLHSTDGALLHRQRLHGSACCSICVRGRGQGLDMDDSTEEVTLCFTNAVSRIHAIQMLSWIMQLSRRPNSATGDLAVAHVKWDLPRSAGPRSGALCLGIKPATLYERMTGRSSSSKLLFLTIGKSPTVASYEGPEWGSEGVLAIVSELASGVAGLAKTLAKGRPNGMRAGLMSWVGGSKAAAVAEKHVGPEKVVVPAGHASTAGGSLADDPRVATTFSVAPRGALAAAGDSLGRVMLIDTATLTVIRLWKSYRHAQMAWMVLPSRRAAHREQGFPGELFLVLHSPKRSQVEVWQPRLGNRVCIWACSRTGILLDPPPSFGSKTAARGPCFMDCEKGSLIDIQQLAQQELASN